MSGPLSWNVSADRRWTEVKDADGGLVALFRDDDRADEYVGWQNADHAAATGDGRWDTWGGDGVGP